MVQCTGKMDAEREKRINFKNRKQNKKRVIEKQNRRISGRRLKDGRFMPSSVERGRYKGGGREEQRGLLLRV